jgi:hypothetical protein
LSIVTGAELPAADPSCAIAVPPVANGPMQNSAANVLVFLLFIFWLLGDDPASF